MPLSPEYTWEESENTVTIVIAAPGLSKAKTDVLISDLQVHVSCQPYLLQLDLRYEVDEVQSSAVFGSSQLSVRLNKAVPGIWGELTFQSSKAELQVRRQESLQRLESRLQADQQAKLQRKQELDRAATDKRIELDRQKRDAIEKLKKQELDAEKDQVAAWQSSIVPQEGGESDYEEDEAFATAPAAEHVEQYHGRGYQPCNATQQEALTASSAISQPSCSEAAEQQQPVHQDIWAAQPSSSDIAASDLSGSTVKTPPTNDEHQDARQPDDADDAQAKQSVAPVRARCRPVEVSFTQLETDHLPARETREQEISALKAKAKVHKAAEDDVDISERQPLFLKDKGDCLHKAGNHRAALNAYTKALQLDASLTACYCNRGLTHLKLQDYRSCIADCTAALAQLEAASINDPADSSAAALSNTMVKVLKRRAAAHSQLLDLPAAAADLTQALSMRPQDKQLKLDLSEVQACLAAVSSATLKSMGDKRFHSKDLQGAAEAYTVVLDFSEATSADKLAAISNRAACYLAQAHYSSTVADCNFALGLLIEQDTKSPNIHAWLSSQGAQQMTDQQQQSLARLLARRGVAHGHLRRYGAAALDLQAAQDIYTSTGNASKAAVIEADMRKMRKFAAGSPVG